MARAPSLSLPDRPIAVKSGLDRKALRDALDKVAAEGGENTRGRVLEILRQTLVTGLAHAEELFSKGRLGGLETASMIAAIHDDVIISLYNYTLAHEVPDADPALSENFSLCAVGGYGRAEMAPQSDVDLLFLTADKKGAADSEQVTEFMLYMLWDLGLTVGHASRTVDQSITLAKEDQTILTALLDLRFLSGNKILADTLYSKFRKDVTRGKGRAYIAEKLEERDIRHEREGNSRYVIEPNIKEGKGGLRDLHVLYWIARFLDKENRITDPQLAESYVELGLFDKQAAIRFRHAADFLWRARIWLHLVSGRATETLSFDKQTELARKMGYASGPIEIAVEKFMREYFTNAKEVGALTRIACAKLEEEKALRLPSGLEALMPRSRRNLKNSALRIDYGRLNFADPMQIRHDPSIILQLFETAGRRNLDIHPEAFSAIDFRRNIIDTEFRRHPDNSKIFTKILLGAKVPYAILKLMNEAGVLGRYLLEFGGIVARTQFNMHHAYTVDEHSLRLVDNFDNLENNRLKEDLPLVSEIAAGFTQEQRLIIYLTCLLHDTGKGQGDQCVEGAQLGRRACRRLGMDKNVTDTVAWLIRRHLDMSETAQRRDISDPETIAEFAKLVGSVERLHLLFVLTVVDIRSVGPGIWNDWKGVLLRGLYTATLAYLHGHEDLAPVAKANAAREQLSEKLSAEKNLRIFDRLDELTQTYWLNFDMADMVRHARFFDQTIQDNVDTAVHTRLTRTYDITELWVLTINRSGLFADLTKAISSCGATIAGARLHTGEKGQVFNVFYLQNTEKLAFGRQSPQALKTLRARAKRAALGDVKDMSIPKPLESRRAGAIPVKPRVKFVKNESDDVTILEIEGRDRPGLLSDIASIFRDNEIEVLSAHIEVAGTRAIDAFYLCLPGTIDGRIRNCALPKAVKKPLKQQLTDLLSPQISHAA